MSEILGGVLSDGAIMQHVDNGELIVKSSFTEKSLQPASYDLTIARDGLITPDSVEVPPHKVWLLPRRVVMGSGDTALFSSRELFRMPKSVAGNISIKNRLAAEGLTLLSGLLIDPGYGLDEQTDDEDGCRLYLHVANTGKDPILLHPGEDQIARVQFLRVFGDVWDKRIPPRPSRWSEQQQASLGFLTELKQLKEDVERSENRSQNIVLFGVVVVAIALIGAAFSTILSIVTNSQLRGELQHAWPNSSDHAVVWGLLLVAAAGFALVFVLAFREIAGWLSSRRRRRRRRSRPRRRMHPAL